MSDSTHNTGRGVLLRRPRRPLTLGGLPTTMPNESKEEQRLPDLCLAPKCLCGDVLSFLSLKVNCLSP